MKQRIFGFDGARLSSMSVESPGRLRWACWNRADGTALIVGDRGTMLSYSEGRLTRVETGTDVNIRCVDISPGGGAAYGCGNSGLILRAEGGKVERISEGVQENLRRVAWAPSGERLLFAGNDGAAYVLSGSKFETLHGADTHLRSIAWHPTQGYALVAGNCFRDSVGGLSPSPNLFRFAGGALEDVSTLAESRADLLSASWKPDGSSCTLVGFDQTWHTQTMISFDGDSQKEVAWSSENIFPTACAWHPSGEYALIGTSPLTSDEGIAALYKYDGRSVTRLSDLNGFGVACIAWSPNGEALILASRSLRAFSA
jgi:WD40 repeat protein